MSTLYDRIKARREELNMSQEELANKLGYKSRSSVNKIEKGENDIPQSKIAAFAKALDTTPGYLMGWEDNSSSISAFVSGQLLHKHGITDYDILKKRCPDKLETIIQGSVTGGIYGYNPPDSPYQYPFIPDAVAAGIPCTIEGRKELPTIGLSDTVMGKYARNKHILIMRVNGESMNKIIPSGSFIAVKTDIEVKSLKDGDLVVFGKEHEYSLKRFYNAGDRIIFKPDSSDPCFTDHVYSKDDIIFIIGKVVLSIRNYE